MYSITTEQQQFLTYILADEAEGTRLKVVPERGGIITQWFVGGENLLYMDEERFADPAMSVRGGVPILFPICGNLPDDSYRLHDQTFHLKQHGFARTLPWQVDDAASTASAEGASLVLSLQSSDETRSHYPFEFKLVFTYQLQGRSLIIHQQVINQGDEPLPFSLGLHPYFAVADKSQLQFQIPATELIDQINRTSHPFQNQFDFAQDEIDVIFPDLSSQQATVVDPNAQTQLTFEADPYFSAMVFWTVKGKDYYCLEPWSAPRNSLNTGDRLTLLPPQSDLETTFSLHLNPLR